MDQQDIEKLKAAGYSDDDIRDYMANQPKASAAPTQTEVQTLPEIDVNQPSEILRNAEKAGTAPGQAGTSYMPEAMAAGSWMAEHPVATGLGAAAAYGLASKLPGVGPAVQSVGQAVGGAASRIPVVGPAMEMGRGAIDAAHAYTASRNAQALSQLENQARQYIKMGQQVPEGLQRSLDALRGRVMGPAPTAPVAPTGAMPTGPVAPQPMAAPAAPAAPATPAQAQPGLLDRTTAMIRQLAANKVLTNVAKGGLGVAAALTPGNVGQNYMVPQAGRMRGMEINPMTGRPWTKEQLATYSANPGMFDSQLPAAQMPR